MLALRSIVWAVLLPGTVAGFIPWRYFGMSHMQVELSDPFQLVGTLFIVSGILLLFACIWEFAARGRGTLSPVDPTRELVVSGLYRYVRNPMYLSVSLILIGEALLARSFSLLVYWAVFFAFVNLFVILYEEPTLRRRYGDSYARYKRHVGRWFPRFTAVSFTKE